MIGKSSVLALTGMGLLAACNPTDDPVASIRVSHDPATVLSMSFVTDFAPYEAAAAALRTLNPLYTVQNFVWPTGFGDPTNRSYSIANGRVEYAHAAGLTGAGQTISIVDTGFLTSHEEFDGKTITSSDGAAGQILDSEGDIESHGTGVASVAAGVADSGRIIGVAPGADLQLGLFDSNLTITNANNQAIATQAIVQNNSWGFRPNLASGFSASATASDFNYIFSGSSGQQYLQSMRNLANNSVLVFAASNDATLTSASLLMGLPVVDPDLESSWIAVVNVLSTFTGTAITSGDLISAPCAEAAAWCMAADGTVAGASAEAADGYFYWQGTSFAAPQVSGAIALLAEAFPTLTAQELRVRLLASAENGFYTHTGSVDFAPGVSHGYDDQFGHGFLNMKAALLPIGGAYVPRSSGGSVPLGSPAILSAGLVGGGLARSLAQYDLVASDGLGAGFDLPASVLTAQGAVRYDPLGTINNLMAADLASIAADPFVKSSAFSKYSAGREVSFEAEDLRIAMLVPDAQGSNFGVAVSRDFGSKNAPFRLGLSALHEGAGFVGIQSLLPSHSIRGSHTGARWEWGIPLAAHQQLALSGSFGFAVPEGGVEDMNLSPVGYNSFNVSYSMANVWGMGDRVTIGLGLPEAIQSGRARVALPMANGLGGTAFNTVDVPLAPGGRQLDISVGYGVALLDGADLIFRTVRSLNAGNITGQNSTEAAIGLRIEF
ncbi:MAG: S8 family peptidase [Paracoccaceae bacterium]